MQDNTPKTFEEIDARLQADLKKISKEIEEIENHLQLGQQMFDDAVIKKLETEIIKKYKKGVDELQRGLDMFLKIREEIEETITKLHSTIRKGDEYINNRD